MVGFFIQGEQPEITSAFKRHTYPSIYFHTFRIWGAHIAIHRPVFPALFGAKDHCCVRCSVGVPQSAVVPATTVWALTCGTAWLVFKTLQKTSIALKTTCSTTRSEPELSCPFFLSSKFIFHHTGSQFHFFTALLVKRTSACVLWAATYILAAACGETAKSRCSSSDSSRNMHHTSFQIWRRGKTVLLMLFYVLRAVHLFASLKT